MGAVTTSKRLGIVIGERQLTTRGGRPKTVTVTLGTPRLPKGAQDWECPFRISGGGMRVLEYGYGVDAIQALQTALAGIRHFLDKSGQSFDWLGMSMDVGLCFPRPIPSYGDERLTRKLETLVDRELERNVALLRRRHEASHKKAAARSSRKR